MKSFSNRLLFQHVKGSRLVPQCQQINREVCKSFHIYLKMTIFLLDAENYFPSFLRGYVLWLPAYMIAFSFCFSCQGTLTDSGDYVSGAQTLQPFPLCWFLISLFHSLTTMYPWVIIQTASHLFEDSQVKEIIFTHLYHKKVDITHIKQNFSLSRNNGGRQHRTH